MHDFVRLLKNAEVAPPPQLWDEIEASLEESQIGLAAPVIESVSLLKQASAPPPPHVAIRLFQRLDQISIGQAGKRFRQLRAVYRNKETLYRRIWMAAAGMAIIMGLRTLIIGNERWTGPSPQVAAVQRAPESADPNTTVKKEINSQKPKAALMRAPLKRRMQEDQFRQLHRAGSPSNYTDRNGTAALLPVAGETNEETLVSNVSAFAMQFGNPVSLGMLPEEIPLEFNHYQLVHFEDGRKMVISNQYASAAILLNGAPDAHAINSDPQNALFDAFRSWWGQLQAGHTEPELRIFTIEFTNNQGQTESVTVLH